MVIVYISHLPTSGHTQFSLGLNLALPEYNKRTRLTEKHFPQQHHCAVAAGATTDAVLCVAQGCISVQKSVAYHTVTWGF